MHTSNLRTKYSRNPDNVPPIVEGSEDLRGSLGFSWEITGPRGAAQSAYQIRVADSQAALDSGENLKWDSGKVEPSESVAIAYDGQPIEPDTTYYWTVRIWDQEGTVSDWGEPA